MQFKAWKIEQATKAGVSVSAIDHRLRRGQIVPMPKIIKKHRTHAEVVVENADVALKARPS